MSKKMNQLICGLTSFVICSTLLFALIYLGAAFVEGSTGFGRDTRQVVVTIFGFGMLFVTPISVFCIAPFFADALEETWRD